MKAALILTLILGATAFILIIIEIINENKFYNHKSNTKK